MSKRNSKAGKAERRAIRAMRKQVTMPDYVPVPAPCDDGEDCRCGTTGHSGDLFARATSAVLAMLPDGFSVHLGATAGGNMMVGFVGECRTMAEARRVAGINGWKSIEVTGGTITDEHETQIGTFGGYSSMAPVVYSDPDAPNMPPWGFLATVMATVKSITAEV